MIYLLDTNAISDWLSPNPRVMDERVTAALRNSDRVVICQPIYYELMRGMLWKNATSKLKMLREKIMPQLEWMIVEDEDWLQAAQFWATTKSRGRQLSDTDLLLAAIAYRRDATIVSSDADFDALSVKREDWRNQP